MQASETIFALWDDARLGNVGLTFINVYGESVALERLNETDDARNRNDAARIVKSMQQLWEDAPDAGIIHTWPMWGHVCEIAEHIFDDDYPSSKRVPMGLRNPSVNMYGHVHHKDGNLTNNAIDNLVIIESEAVAPDDDIQDGGEPAPDVSLEDLSDDEADSDTE